MPCSAQQIRFYSEFQRFDPWGEAVAADRDLFPREVISPSIARNGHLSLHVVITAAAGTNYFLYCAANPPGALKLTLYRERFVPCGNTYCPDWLTEIPSPSFGAIPESLSEMRGQTTRSYLMDIYALPGTVSGRVRVEAQLKTATWQIAPLEVRVVAGRVPELVVERKSNTAEPGGSASDTAQIQLQRWLEGLAPQVPVAVLRLRDITQRNAAEDMLMADSGLRVPLALLWWSPVRWKNVGAEWYLRVRDMINSRNR